MKGYQLYTMTNGFDAIEFISNNEVDFILLDESMPGMSGLETLQRIKQLYPHMPVVLVTKNETESLMEEAIGAQITDYLIKPVHPHQVLLTLKKNLENNLDRLGILTKKTVSLEDIAAHLDSLVKKWSSFDPTSKNAELENLEEICRISLSFFSKLFGVTKSYSEYLFIKFFNVNKDGM